MRDQRIVRNQKATRAATAAKSTPPPAILEKKIHLCLEMTYGPYCLSLVVLCRDM